MYDPIITAADAEYLNKNLQDKVDKRLFFFCNYTPTAFPSFSEEGFFKNAVQDLYKFVFDSTFVFSWINKPECQHFKDLDIKASCNCISNLRSLMDHNQSENNGYCENACIHESKKWFQKILNKDKVETETDYGLLNNALRNMADKIKLSAERIINDISGLSSEKKKEFVNKWIDETIIWYSKDIKSIYIGTIIDCFFQESKDKYKNVNTLLKNYMLYEENKDNEAVKAVCKKYWEIFDKESEDYLENISAEFINSNKEIIKKFKDNYLKNALKNTRDSLDKENKEYCLLPKDFLQRNIADLFGRFIHDDGFGKETGDNWHWELTEKENGHD